MESVPLIPVLEKSRLHFPTKTPKVELVDSPFPITQVMSRTPLAVDVPEELLEEVRQEEERQQVLRRGVDLSALVRTLPPQYAGAVSSSLAHLVPVQRALAAGDGVAACAQMEVAPVLVVDALSALLALNEQEHARYVAECVRALVLAQEASALVRVWLRVLPSLVAALERHVRPPATLLVAAPLALASAHILAAAPATEPALSLADALVRALVKLLPEAPSLSLRALREICKVSSPPPSPCLPPSDRV